MNTSFYNTVNLTGADLAAAVKQARHQGEAVLALYREHGRLSPSQAHKLYGDEHTPLTSIRRAIHCLTEHGRLVKTDAMVAGEYGKPEHVWELYQGSGNQPASLDLFALPDPLQGSGTL